ncbi:MAG: CoA ester lyase [Gammaproteobacteria bacterium]|nr:CoA ester lyase [Gammaproteobacteria bacterium]
MDVTSTRNTTRRSVLVYSALATDRWDEAMHSGADVIFFDLEDGTTEERKDEGRTRIIETFAQGMPTRPNDAPISLLRVNPPRTLHGLRDLVAVMESAVRPDGLVLPKVGHPEEVRWVADVLQTENLNLELMPLIEDQAGLRAAHEIAQASELVRSLFLGSVDLSGELRTAMGWDALYDARATLVRATSAAGIDCIDGPWLAVDDVDGLRDEAQRVASMGFTGKASYDPSQLTDIHAAFTPSSAQIALAERVIEAVDSSATGAARVDGRSVNKANAKGARRLLARAREMGVLG